MAVEIYTFPDLGWKIVRRTEGNPHVLQIKLLGNISREPSGWRFFADGECAVDGSGAFARECFCEGAEVFLNLCRDVVESAELHQWSQRGYELLSAARGAARTLAICGMVACSRCPPPLKPHDVKSLALAYAF